MRYEKKTLMSAYTLDLEYTRPTFYTKRKIQFSKGTKHLFYLKIIEILVLMYKVHFCA